MVNIGLATPAGQPQINKDNQLCKKLGTLARTDAHIRQCVERESSNFLTIILEFIAALSIMLGLIIAAWCLAVIS